MTVKQLKEKIKDLPDNMDVFVGERLTDTTYGLVNSANVIEITFFDFSDERASDDCLVLDES